jgi:hypothetical protein
MARPDYLDAIEANLLQPLSVAAHRGFGNGSGSELADTPARPAKMKALHSSAALAVNVFDYWTTRDSAPLTAAMGIASRIREMAFERQFPTGLGARRQTWMWPCFWRQAKRSPSRANSPNG